MKTSLKDFASCELDELFEGNGLLLINYLIIAKLEKYILKKCCTNGLGKTCFFITFLIFLQSFTHTLIALHMVYNICYQIYKCIYQHQFCISSRDFPNI